MEEKRKRGRPKGSKNKKVEAPAELASENMSTELARSIVWAAEWMNDARMTRNKAGSRLQYSLWQTARDYPKEFNIQLLPKALNILDKAAKEGEPPEMVEAEKRSVEELEEFLKRAVKEAE